MHSNWSLMGPPWILIDTHRFIYFCSALVRELGFSKSFFYREMKSVMFLRPRRTLRCVCVFCFEFTSVHVCVYCVWFEFALCPASVFALCFVFMFVVFVRLSLLAPNLCVTHSFPACVIAFVLSSS